MADLEIPPEDGNVGKDLFAGAAGGIAQVLIGALFVGRGISDDRVLSTRETTRVLLLHRGIPLRAQTRVRLRRERATMPNGNEINAKLMKLPSYQKCLGARDGLC